MSKDLTRMLQDVDAGHDGALDRLMETVYEDLRRIAERHLSERYGRGLAGVTLEPEALVNESFLRLIKQRNKYDNRGQFFAIATKVMIRVLVDYQRHRMAQKRGGDRKKMTLCLDRHGGLAPVEQEEQIDVDVLVHCLDELEGLDARKADVVKMRVVWGLEMREIAAALDVSIATVERDWAFAKAWLAREADRALEDSTAEAS
jgi:RNA polymerase sigma factor (TIGR02999 family)